MQDLFDNNDMTRMAQAISDGEVTAEEVLECTLARIDERNPLLGAIIAERADQARSEVDAGLPAGPLRGVPFAIKDLGADVEGPPTTNGSRLFADDIAATDSPLVKAYRAAGMVIVGKTNTPEWGQNASTEPALFGPTRNPHRIDHSPGGSSGGSAAAVASGMLPAAHASDGGGSIRIPSAMCGLVGLKPSRGRTAAGNPLTSPLSVQHAITRSVRDSALLLDIASAPQVGAPLTIAPPTREYVQEVGADPGRLRIAAMTALPDGGPVHDECAAVVEDAVALLAELGHGLTAAAPDFGLEGRADTVRRGVAATTAMHIDARLARLGRGLRDDDLESSVRAIYERTKSLDATAYPLAMEAITEISASVGRFFEHHDLLLTPTLGAPTPRLGLLDAGDIEAIWRHAGAYSAMVSPFNITGQPAISLPIGHDSTGMPLGLHIVAAFGREDLLIRIASQIERARPWDIRPVWPARD